MLCPHPPPPIVDGDAQVERERVNSTNIHVNLVIDRMVSINMSPFALKSALFCRRSAAAAAENPPEFSGNVRVSRNSQGPNNSRLLHRNAPENAVRWHICSKHYVAWAPSISALNFEKWTHNNTSAGARHEENRRGQPALHEQK